MSRASETPIAAPAAVQSGLNGWVEAGLFAIALSVLNIAYGVGHQYGVHPIAFLAIAMPVAASTLLTFNGAGPHWWPIIRHPLSYVVGGGIIAMEAFYYMLLQVTTPTDGSLLVRLNVPAAALLGFALLGRRPAALGLVGQAIVLAGVFGYVAIMEAGNRGLGVALAVACALNMSIRAFATEFHPWNRAARTITEKMRLTGLVLLVTSLMGAVIVFGLMAMVARGSLVQPAWLPEVQHFLHEPTLILGLFMGVLVLTAMQYLGFSVVVKIQSENFVATTALIPPVTLAMQLVAVRLGILAPVPFDWSVLPAMLVVGAGVLIVIWAGRKTTSNP